MLKILYSVLVLAVLSQPSFSACATAWTNGYGFCRSITIDHTKVPNTDQTDFPVVVLLTNIDFATVANGGKINNTVACCAQGISVPADMIFTSDSNGLVPLTWEWEQYTPTTGFIIIWVKIPSVSHTVDTVFYVFYGKASTVTYQSTYQQVWSNGFIFVQHAADVAALVDSAGDIANGSNIGPVGNVLAVIDGGSSYSVALPYQDYGTSALLAPPAMTLSVWMATDLALSRPYNGIVTRIHSTGTPGYQLLIKSSGKLLAFVNDSAGTAIGYDGTGTNTLLTNTHYYLAMTYQGNTNFITYVDGGVDKTIAATANGLGADPTLHTYFGRTNFPGQEFVGTIDEVRVASVVRSGDWLTTEHNNQRTPSTFVSLGAQVTPGPYMIPRRRVTMR